MSLTGPPTAQLKPPGFQSTRMAPQGSKSAYTSKQKRQAHHIEASVKRRGGSSKKAARIAYATVNKQDKGGKKSGSGRGKRRTPSSSSKGARKGGRATRSSRMGRRSRS
jgi:hypothetical protein